MRSPDPVPQSKAWLGWAAILTVSLIGGGNFVISRYGIKAHISANDMTALRFGIVGILLLPLLWRQGFWSLAGIGLRRGLILTTLAGAPFSLLMLWGLHFAPATHGAVLIPGSIPIFTAIGLRLVSGIKISTPKICAFLIVFTGLALVSGFSGGRTPQILFGDMLFVIAGAAWSVYTILLRRWQLDAWRLTSVVSVLSLLYLPVYFGLMRPDFGEASFELIAVIGLYHALLLSVAALILYSVAVRHIGPQRTALGNSLVPVLAALLAVPVLGEIPTPIQWLGIACVVGGVILAARMPDILPAIHPRPAQ